MINFVSGFAFLAVITLFWTATYGTVTELPWGMEEPFQIFMQQINILRNMMPWLDELWKFIVYVLVFEIAYFVYLKTWDIIKLIRG